MDHWENSRRALFTHVNMLVVRLTSAWKGALTGGCYQSIYKVTVTHPTHVMNDMWKADHTTGETFPSLFELQCGFFYVPSGFSLTASNRLKNRLFWGLSCLLLWESGSSEGVKASNCLRYFWLPSHLLLHPSCLLLRLNKNPAPFDLTNETSEFMLLLSLFKSRKLIQ